MRSAVAIALALFLLALAMWTVVPAPTMPLLIVTVAVSELSYPFVWIVVAIGGGLTILATGVRSRVAVMLIIALAVAALARPLVAAVATWPRAAAALDAAGIAPLRPRPLVAVDVTRDVAVALRDGTELALDVYRPRVRGTLPLIVTIYGGAWIFGSRAADAPLARWYAARGYAVAVIDYRHAPEYRFPTQIDDVDDALKTIARHAHEWHVDANRVALFGRSAGAQLALLAGERAQPLGVRALVAYYAPTDLVDGWQTPPVPDPVGARHILELYLGGPPNTTRLAFYRLASPLDQAHAGMPPVFAIIGDRDTLVRPQLQRAFAARLTALHVRHVALELPWASHGFDGVDGLGAALAQRSTLRFLDALL